jgi:hypothetical protein
VLALKGGSSAECSAVSRWEFVSLLPLPKLQATRMQTAARVPPYMYLSKAHQTPLQVENGVCCMIGKSKGARKKSMHGGLQHSTAKHDISAHEADMDGD